MKSRAPDDKSVELRPGDPATADAALEAGSDQRWMLLSAAAMTATDLAAMGTAFQDLLRERDAIERKFAALISSNDWSAVYDSERGEALDPLSERLYELAATMAELPAVTPEQHRIKAMALAEFCEEQSNDLTHRLAASLAADLLRP